MNGFATDAVKQRKENPTCQGTTNQKSARKYVQKAIIDIHETI